MPEAQGYARVVAGAFIWVSVQATPILVYVPHKIVFDAVFYPGTQTCLASSLMLVGSFSVCPRQATNTSFGTRGRRSTRSSHEWPNETLPEEDFFWFLCSSPLFLFSALYHPSGKSRHLRASSEC